MQRKTYPSITSPPIIGRNQVDFKSSQQQQRYMFQSSQSRQGANYTAYLGGLSLGALQKELQAVREREKQFYKLNYQLKMLEKKSRLVTEESRKLSQGESDNEDQQIAQLKAQIQGVNQDIKSITEEAKLVKKQCSESKGHLKLLQEQLQKAKNQNYNILQQVNEKKAKLLQKSSIIQQLKQSQLQNHKQVTNLRQEIKSLQQQSHLLESELKVLTQQKQNKEKNKEKLQKIISELQKELLHQKDHERQTHYKLSNVKALKHDLEDQLVCLRKQQQTQILQYESKLQDYHNVCVLVKESDLKKKTLEDELLVVQNDLQQLNLQFISQGDLLTKEQEQNTAINQEFDQITKEAIDVWNSICELIKIQQHEQNSTASNQLLFPNTQLANPHNQIKFKALKVWKQIQSILQVNQNQ